MALSRPVLAVALLGCSALGFYATVGVMATNGLGDAILSYVIEPPHRGIPGAPEPMATEYTGFTPIDTILRLQVGYFSALFDGDVAPETRLFAIWGMVQFGACWALLVLEGLRAGNRGKLISWTGTFALIFQTVSWTLAAPLWLILHIFTSPIATLSPSSPAASSDLLVDLGDLSVLPLIVVLTYFAPAVPMMFSGSFSARTHYLAMALWQPFGLCHSILQPILRRAVRLLGGEHTAGPKTYLVQVKSVYGFVVLLSVATQVTVLQLALAPSQLRESLALTVPTLGALAGPSVSFASVFVPAGLLAPPTVDPATIASGDLAPLATFFLQYDMYFGCGALLLWALYLHRTAVPKISSPMTAAKVAWWFLLGGFAAAAATLLWERDSIVDEKEDRIRRKTK